MRAVTLAMPAFERPKESVFTAGTGVSTPDCITDPLCTGEFVAPNPSA